RDADLPPKKAPTTGPPPYGRWEQRNPDAAARADNVRPVVRELAEEIGLPQENLLSPDLVRTLCWDGLADGQSVDDWLSGHGARPWQREIVAAPISRALR